MTAMFVMAWLGLAWLGSACQFKVSEGQGWLAGWLAWAGRCLWTVIVFPDIISHIVQLQHNQHQPSPPPLTFSPEAKSVSLWVLNFLETRRIILLNNMFIKKIGSCGFILHSTLFTWATSDSAPHQEISNKKCD